MTILQAIILGLIQGITEFIPVSSSGHLVVFEDSLGLDASQFLGFDIVVHGATLLVLFIYFAKDFKDMILALIPRGGSATVRKEIAVARHLILMLMVATIPAVFFGLMGKGFFELMRDPATVFLFMIVIAEVFVLAELFAARNKKKNEKELTVWRAFVIGLFQAAALFPGISRSGATIAGGLFMGQERLAAARFSFLLGAIAIGGAVALSVPDFLEVGVSGLGAAPLIAGFTAAAISGYFSISFLMKYLKKRPLYVFAGYLMVFGLGGLLFG